MSDAPLALSHLTVLDLGRIRAAPSAARFLGDMGANVIKIEMPPDPADDGGYTGSRHSPDFQNLHRNKRSITLNLKSEDGKRILFRMAEKADVVIENFRPDVKHRLGIDYEAMRKVNPRIVYGSISGFGQTGPYAGRAGVDQIAQGMGGLMSVTGLPGQGPVRAGTAIADLSSGMYLVMGILAALVEREVSGEGQWVHTSLLESQLAIMDFQAARYLIAGDVPVQEGNNHPTNAPTGVFPTADGHINIAAAGVVMFRRLCKVLGAEDLAERPEFKDPRIRVRNREAVNAAIGEITRTKTSAEWIELFSEASVPSGPIYNMEQAFADPHVRQLGLPKPVEHPVLGTISVVGQPVTLSRTPQQVRAPTPELGEHTDELLREFGFDDGEIARFRQEGAV